MTFLNADPGATDWPAVELDQVVRPDTAFYLSFCDPEVSAVIPVAEQRPGGRSWLGGCYVLASEATAAVAVAHLHGCNPGGEVGIMGPFPAEAVRPEYLNRLLTDAEDVERAAADG